MSRQSIHKNGLRALVGALALYLGACGSTAPLKDLPPAGENAERPVLFIADPQFHNMYGVGLRQMLPLADFFARVAIRPPELNLLAPYAFANLLSQAEKANGGVMPLVVVLGDATNIACSGEFDDFVKVMNEAV